MEFWLIERMAPGLTTWNFTLQAETREAAIAQARNLGIEPLACQLYDRPYRLNQTEPTTTLEKT
jgi:hypothetical protein